MKPYNSSLCSVSLPYFDYNQYTNFIRFNKESIEMIEENYLIRHDAYITLTDDVVTERVPFDAFLVLSMQ